MSVASNSSDIAQAIERGIAGQSDLLTTLAVAIIAGLLAVLYQTRVLNAGLASENRIALRHMLAFWAAIVFAGLVVFFGYGVTGYLIQYAPALHSHGFDPSKPFVNQVFESDNIQRLRSFSQFQALFFTLAIVAGIWFVFVNRK